MDLIPCPFQRIPSDQREEAEEHEGISPCSERLVQPELDRRIAHIELASLRLALLILLPTLCIRFLGFIRLRFHPPREGILEPLLPEHIRRGVEQVQ